MKNHITKILSTLATAVIFLDVGFIPKPIPAPPEDIPITQPGENDNSIIEPQFDIPIDETDEILQ